MERERVVLSWSGGKDSALALSELLRTSAYEVVGLLTTVTREYDRISMHGVRRALLEAQARATGLPLTVVEISAGAPNGEYEARMGEALARFRDEGVWTVAFGDLFLEEIRHYREERLEPVGMKALFPLWGRDTGELAREFVERGFRAMLACVDSQQLDGTFAGRDFDARLLAELPPSVDPCGENGEFHTFVHAGPVLSRPIPVRTGEVVCRDERFYFCDLY
jgi:uncharacterized protein (TIGR00290 family)